MEDPLDRLEARLVPTWLQQLHEESRKKKLTRGQEIVNKESRL